MTSGIQQFVVSVLILIPCWSVSFAQTDEIPDFEPDAGVTLGLGFGLGGGIFNVSYSHPLFGGMVSGSYRRGAQLNLDVGGNGPEGTLDDFDLLYGLTKSNDQIIMSISAGVSYLIFEDWDSSNELRRTIGFPIEGQFLNKVSETVALGFILYANINSYHTTGGFILCVRLG